MVKIISLRYIFPAKQTKNKPEHPSVAPQLCRTKSPHPCGWQARPSTQPFQTSFLLVLLVQLLGCSWPLPKSYWPSSMRPFKFLVWESHSVLWVTCHSCTTYHPTLIPPKPQVWVIWVAQSCGLSKERVQAVAGAGQGHAFRAIVCSNRKATGLGIRR